MYRIVLSCGLNFNTVILCKDKSQSWEDPAPAVLAWVSEQLWQPPGWACPWHSSTRHCGEGYVPHGKRAPPGSPMVQPHTWHFSTAHGEGSEPEHTISSAFRHSLWVWDFSFPPKLLLQVIKYRNSSKLFLLSELIFFLSIWMACNRAAILERMPSFALLKNQSRRKSGVNKTAHRHAAELTAILFNFPELFTIHCKQLLHLHNWLTLGLGVWI